MGIFHCYVLFFLGVVSSVFLFWSQNVGGSMLAQESIKAQDGWRIGGITPTWCCFGSSSSSNSSSSSSCCCCCCCWWWWWWWWWWCHSCCVCCFLQVEFAIEKCGWWMLMIDYAMHARWDLVAKCTIFLKHLYFIEKNSTCWSLWNPSLKRLYYMLMNKKVHLQ